MRTWTFKAAFAAAAPMGSPRRTLGFQVRSPVFSTWGRRSRSSSDSRDADGAPLDPARSQTLIDTCTVNTSALARGDAVPKVNEEPQSNVEVSSESGAGYDALGNLLMYNWSTPRGLTARWCQLQARVAVDHGAGSRTVVVGLR